MRRKIIAALLALSLFGVVLGLKLDVVHRFGSDLPMWDQWDAEGMTVFVPWSKGQLTLEHLFSPHNEHRVALTRLLSMGTLAANGQWDARLQCVVNAMLHAGLAVALFGFSRRLLGPAWSAANFALIAILIGLPLAWQNVISGFHSQQYFLLLLSLGAIALLPTSPAWSARWWCGLASGFLALFSMGSGLLAAIAAAAAVVIEIWRDPRSWRSHWPTLLACAVLTGVGASLLVHYAGHDPLRAKSLGEFLLYTVHNLQWPLDSAWWALLLWAPMLALAVPLLRRSKDRMTSDATVLFALGGWTFAQIVASAYARGAGAGFPASRYMDTLAFGMIVNGFAAFLLFSRAKGMLRHLALAGVVAWCAALGTGTYRLAQSIYTHALPEVRDYHVRCETNVRAYLATNDPGQLRNDDFPYPNLNNFRARIDQPALRAIMPASVRPALQLRTARGAKVMRLDQAGPAGRSWTSSEGHPGRWESVIIDFPRPTTLLFRFTGNFDDKNPPSLEWRDTRLGLPVADVIAARVPGDGNFSATVRLPSGKAQLVAQISDPRHELTFEEPVEVARFSALAARFASFGPWIALWAGAAGATLLILELRRARH